MTNLRYAIIIIGALSLLLGLSLGQIYYQHKRIEQLEFNRFRQMPMEFRFQHRDHPHRAYRDALDRAREQGILLERLEEVMRRYNPEEQRWEWDVTEPEKDLRILIR